MALKPEHAAASTSNIDFYEFSKTSTNKNVDGDPHAPYSLCVVGAGIAGLLTACAIKKFRPNITVTVFEAARTFSEIGAGMSLDGNTQICLEMVGLYDAFAEIADLGGFATYDLDLKDHARENRNARTGELVHLDTSKVAGAVHRARLLEMLVTALPEDVRVLFGKRAFDLQQTKEEVHMTFKDSQRGTVETHSFHAVIAADGVKSAIRKLCYPKADNECFSYSGFYAYRAAVSAEEASKVAGPHFATVPTRWMGDGYATLTYPVDGGKLINIAGFVMDQDRPRGKCEYNGPPNWIVDVSFEEMMDDYRDSCHGLKAIMGMIKKPNRWYLHEVGPLNKWAFDRVLLLGDAAHAMLPMAGAGAGQAIEDAVLLAKLLAELDCTATTLPSYLELAEKVRKPRALKVQQISHDFGRLWCCRWDASWGSDAATCARYLSYGYAYIRSHDLSKDVSTAVRQIQPLPSKSDNASRMPFTILGISGSLRKMSWNTKLLRASAELIPNNASFELLDWSDVPIFNEDLEDPELMPKAVLRVRAKVAAANALIFATPEYNHSIPGGLKNLIDWLSRSYTPTGQIGPSVARYQPLNGKVAAVIGLHPQTGSAGTARGQAALRAALVFPNVFVLNSSYATHNAAVSFKEDSSGRSLDTLKDDEPIRDRMKRLYQKLIAMTRRLEDD